MGARSRLCESNACKFILMYMPVDINPANQYFESVHLMYYSRINIKHDIQQQKVALRTRRHAGAALLPTSPLKNFLKRPLSLSDLVFPAFL